MFRVACLLLCAVVISRADECKPSISTASGPNAPKQICAGQLIFDEPFDEMNKKLWQPLSTFWDGGNNEFQWYTKDDENSFAGDSIVYLSPTLTADKIGADKVINGHINLPDCTDGNPANCVRQAGGNKIINPVRSARLTTEKSFSFKYGRVVAVAKVPEGDWLWPALWLMPTKSKYGGWPRSGEIDMLEGRGNLKYGGDVQIGVEQVSSTLHFGPSPDKDGFRTATFSKNNAKGYHTVMHTFEMIWDDKGIKFSVDGDQVGYVEAGDGFWKRGGFQGDDIYKDGTKMAPFDDEFHFIINLAVGGNFFPDVPNQNGKRPWFNPETAMKDFWNARDQWYKTWKDKKSAAFQIDDLKVYAI